jgi:ABC-2 type transport system permease protein
VTLGGVATVGAGELRQRLRAGRWRVLLLAWFLVLAVVTLGLRQFGASAQTGDPFATPTGAVMFGGLSLFLLVVALLVVPALSSQSVNGDRERGVLATLQVTDLTPGEIALGKFAAAWGVSLVFLLVSLPLGIWSLLEGGVGIKRLLVVTVVQALLLGVVAAVSLALSALLARTTTSAVLSYLSVLGLTVGTVIAFGLATTLVGEKVHHGSVSQDGFASSSYDETVTHTERIWWLLAPNPVVVMVDASPAPPLRSGDLEFAGDLPVGGQLTAQQYDEVANANDPLRAIRRSVRDLRRAPDTSTSPGGTLTFGHRRPAAPGAVWPWGLGFDVLLGIGALITTTRRLRTPTRVLPRGTRVA